MSVGGEEREGGRRGSEEARKGASERGAEGGRKGEEREGGGDDLQKDAGRATTGAR